VTSLALFDLDNTLLDREAAFATWRSKFIASRRLDHAALAVIDRADADGGTPREEFFAVLRRELNIGSGVDELLADYDLDYPSNFSADPGMIEAVRRLRRSGFKIGIVTNGRPTQRAKLDAAGIAEEFDAVCISAEVGSEKPDRTIFGEAARRCGAPLAGWMVGDSAEADIIGGANAGLRTIWMPRGREWTLDAHIPDHIAGSVPQAVELILGSN